jgi:hypothetical protein
MVDDYEFEEPPDEPHEFETDVRNVVLINLNLVLDGIAGAHAAEVKKFQPPRQWVGPTVIYRLDWNSVRWVKQSRNQLSLGWTGDTISPLADLFGE